MERRSPSYELEVDDESTPLPPNSRLLTAVLFRAVRDFVNYRHAKPGTQSYKIAVDAAGWLWWNGTENMTFLKICEVVGLDPHKIRKVTLKLTPDELRRMTHTVEAEDCEHDPEDED